MHSHRDSATHWCLTLTLYVVQYLIPRRGYQYAFRYPSTTLSSCIHHRNYARKGLGAWWRHQMETFSELPALCEGNTPVTKAGNVELWCFFICAWTNGWVNNPNAGNLRRHRAHYDVIVMWFVFSKRCALYLNTTLKCDTLDSQDNEQ